MPIRWNSTTCVAALLLCLPPLSQGQAPAQYAIKADEPPTGSRIRMDVVHSGPIAVNLPYQELPPGDRASLHALYERIADGDEPPFPTRGLRALFDPISHAQAKLLLKGQLFLIATVGPQGKVVQVKVMRSPSPEMAQFAAHVMAQTPYKPAVCSGQPCTMDFPLILTLQVE